MISEGVREGGDRSLVMEDRAGSTWSKSTQHRQEPQGGKLRPLATQESGESC